MKLQKQLTEKRGDKIYHKYVVVIPPEAVEDAGFKEGDELVANVKKGSINLQIKKK